MYNGFKILRSVSTKQNDLKCEYLLFVFKNIREILGINVLLLRLRQIVQVSDVLFSDKGSILTELLLKNLSLILLLFESSSHPNLTFQTLIITSLKWVCKNVSVKYVKYPECATLRSLKIKRLVKIPEFIAILSCYGKYEPDLVSCLGGRHVGFDLVYEFTESTEFTDFFYAVDGLDRILVNALEVKQYRSQNKLQYKYQSYPFYVFWTSDPYKMVNSLKALYSSNKYVTEHRLKQQADYSHRLFRSGYSDIHFKHKIKTVCWCGGNGGLENRGSTMVSLTLCSFL
jgi:hypothetical protein